MEIYASLFHVFTSLGILIGFTLLYFRIKHFLSTEKSSKSIINALFLGTIWLPIPINEEDSEKEKRKKKSLNFALTMFYVILFLLIIIYGILPEIF